MRVIFHDEVAMPPAGTFTKVKPEFMKGELVCMPAALIPTPRPTPIPCSLGNDPPTPAKTCAPVGGTPPLCIENECRTRTPTPAPYGSIRRR